MALSQIFIVHCHHTNILVGLWLLIGLVSLCPLLITRNIRTSSTDQGIVSLTLQEVGERWQVQEPSTSTTTGIEKVHEKATRLLQQSTRKNEKSRNLQTISTAGSGGHNLPDDSLQLQSFYEHHYRQVTSLINDTTALVWQATHPSHRFAPFRNAFAEYYQVPHGANASFVPPLWTNNSTTTPVLVEWKNLCHAAKAFTLLLHNEHDNLPRRSSSSHPHVLVLSLDENWGAFSEHVPNKTVSWVTSLEAKWNKAGCTRQEIMHYINHPDTKAVVTTQFQALRHPKILSLPLGIPSLFNVRDMLQVLRETSLDDDEQQQRSQWLMINSQRRNMRGAIIDRVIANFHGTVHNSYPTNPKASSYRDYLLELRRSKFILSPSGIGLDCYRHWEAIFMGTIPVLEHHNRTEDGWYQVFDNLPVAWIDSYDNLTPEFLEQEYQRIISAMQEQQQQQTQSPSFTYDYAKLTKDYWINLIQAKLQA